MEISRFMFLESCFIMKERYYEDITNNRSAIYRYKAMWYVGILLIVFFPIYLVFRILKALFSFSFKDFAFDIVGYIQSYEVFFWQEKIIDLKKPLIIWLKENDCYVNKKGRIKKQRLIFKAPLKANMMDAKVDVLYDKKQLK